MWVKPLSHETVLTGFWTDNYVIHWLLLNIESILTITKCSHLKSLWAESHREIQTSQPPCQPPNNIEVVHGWVFLQSVFLRTYRETMCTIASACFECYATQATELDFHPDL